MFNLSGDPIPNIWGKKWTKLSAIIVAVAIILTAARVLYVWKYPESVQMTPPTEIGK